MKINIISILAPLAAVAILAGCTKTAPERTWASDPDAVHIEASVLQTKTSPDGSGGFDPSQFLSNDEIAVYDGSKTVTYWFDGDYWFPKPETDYLVWKAPVTYKAWYPASSKDGFDLPTDQSRSNGSAAAAGNFAKADFMIGKYDCASKGDIPSDHKLKLTMQRKMALVTVNVDKNRLKSQFDGKDIYMIRVETIQSGLSHVSSDGTGSGSPVDVKPGPYDKAYENGKGDYHAIVVPCDGDASANFLKITVCWKPGYDEDKAELYVTGRPKFEAGKHYTYNLTIGKDKVEAGDITVSDWGTTVDLNDGKGEFDADKAPDPVSVSDLRKQLEDWNKANPENKKELKDLITKELLDECCVGGKLILTGEFDNTNELCLGMSEETIEAFAVIAAYVRDNDVTYLDMSGLKGVKQLISISPAVSGKAEEYNLRFSSVIYENSKKVGAGSKLETFIGSEDLVNITRTFEGCVDLVSVSGLKNVTHADYAFAACSKLSKTPDLPNVLSLKYSFSNTSITELKYESVKEIAINNCMELTVIDCPNAVKLEEYVFSGGMPKLTDIYLKSKSFELVYNTAFDHLIRGQVTLHLDASQKGNIDVTNNEWTPKKSNGDSAVDGGKSVPVDLLKAVFCGEEQIIPKI